VSLNALKIAWKRNVKLMGFVLMVVKTKNSGDLIANKIAPHKTVLMVYVIDIQVIV